MDNGFGEDEGMRQARSRRGFQTGLLLFLLLFFARAPQDNQVRSRRGTQNKTSEKNMKTIAKTVDKLVDRLEKDPEYAPQGPFYNLRQHSTITGEWRRADDKDIRTVVPAMEKQGSGSQQPKDLRNQTIAPDMIGTVPLKSTEMSATNSPVLPTQGNDVSLVSGTLGLGTAITQTNRNDATFEGLFFHKYGHLTAVIGGPKYPLKVVWNPAGAVATNTAAATDSDAAAAAAPDIVATIVDESVGGDRMALGSNANETVEATAAEDGDGRGADSSEAGGMDSTAERGSDGGGGEQAIPDEVEVEVDVDEGKGDKNGEGDTGSGTTGGGIERAGAGGGGAVVEGEGEGGGGGGGGGADDRTGRALRDQTVGDESRVGGQRSPAQLERGPAESTEEAAAAGGAAAITGARLWSEKERQGGRVELGGSPWGGVDRSGRTGDVPRSSLLALLPRHLDDGGGGAEADSSVVTPKDDGDTVAVTPEAGGDEDGDGDEADGDEEEAAAAAAEAASGGGSAVLTRDFPAWVLPTAAVSTAGQESGPLPTQFVRVAAEYDKGCQFLLNLQTVDDGDDAGDNAGDTESTGAIKADLMRGEMVGINCNFSAIVELRLSDYMGRTSQTQPMGYSVALTMVCLLQMCLLCCRVGLMLAQRRYGRNFMVPRRFQPPKFDYHRPIPPELSEQAGTETAGGQHSEETRDLEAGNCFECAICYAAVDSSLDDYMLTPCDHVFHQGCLTRWMDIKMECPTCRRELPPQLERNA